MGGRERGEGGGESNQNALYACLYKCQKTNLIDREMRWEYILTFRNHAK